MSIEDSEFVNKLREVINTHSKENDSDTPDFILAEYLNDCLRAFSAAVAKKKYLYDINHIRQKPCLHTQTGAAKNVAPAHRAKRLQK